MRSTRQPPVRRRAGLLALAAIALLPGCRQDMHDQPKLKPFQKSSFFADGRDSRPLIDGTVARGHLDEDAFFFTGKVDGKPVAQLPFPATREVLERGHQRFDAYCSPCHGRVGDGEGMIVQRGMKQPASFHEDRLRQAPDGYFFDVISNGFGVMLNYAQQIPPRDRWAVIAYVRALQLSQGAAFAALPAEDRARVQQGASLAAPPAGDGASGHAAGGHP